MSLKHDFPKLVEGDDVYREKAGRLAAKVFNFSELAAQKIPSPSAPSFDKEGVGGISARETVTYHDACHLKRGCGVYEEPRRVLEGIAGVEVREMTDCDKCCGFGGSYAIKYPEISQEVLKNKLENIVATGAQTVAVDCPGCKLQIEGGLEAAGSTVRVEHTATLVARRLAEEK
jgi:Fe-S oxidoreductase